MKFQQRRELKREAYGILGSKCVQCGFNDMRALQIDHVRGDGALERKIGGKNTTELIYKFIVAEPVAAKSRYQILCANCNIIKNIANREWTGRRSLEVLKERSMAKKLWGYTPRELETITERRASRKTLRAERLAAELDQECLNAMRKDK